MITVPCDNCALATKCNERPETHRKAFFGYARAQVVRCSDWIERRWRGLEGVRA